MRERGGPPGKMAPRSSSSQPHVLLGQKSRPTLGPGTSGFQMTLGQQK